MADIALFDQVITGEPRVSEPAPLAGLRLGVARDSYLSELDTEVETATTDALRQLEDAGAILVEADVPNLAELISLTTAQVQLYHVKPMLERYLQEFETGLTLDDVMAAVSDDIRATFEEFVLGGAGTPSEADFIAARDEHLPALRQTMRAYFEDNGLDAMVFPAAQITATPVGQDTEVVLNGRTVPFEAVVSRNISPGSTAGLPGLTVPVAQDLAGLPISLEIDGPAGSDRAMLGIGLALEGLFGHLPNPSV
jgi:Asp-tRNA(Asn)/Glu-tRNA(Gln) amidotransferase A subunit family amidase